LTAITANAAASVRDEAGCLRFDVMEDAQRPTHYFYEIYRDSEAFGEYKAAPHFAVWRRAAGACGARQPDQHLLRHGGQP
jgi:(4S)-4-hydroxy-5-phosphonooxypentane-2,3-dione isomerase